MASSKETFRGGDLSGLRDSVDLAKVARSAVAPELTEDARAACAALAAPHILLGPVQCDSFSAALGFDAARLCAAHNVVVLSALADSVRISTLHTLLDGLVASPDEVQSLLAAMIALPQSVIAGALIDEVAGMVRFRPHELNHGQWAEKVYGSL